MQAEVGAYGECNPALAPRIFEAAQFEDRPWRAVPSCLQIAKSDVVRASVDTVDDGVGCAAQLVVETAIEQPPDNGCIEAFGGQDITARPALDPALGQGAVHSFDNVATLAERAQGRLGPVVNHPLILGNLIGKTKGFELAQAADLLHVILVGRPIGTWGKIDGAGARHVAAQLTVKLGPAFGFDLPLQIAADVEIRPRAEFLGNEIGGSGAHPFLDVVA